MLMIFVKLLSNLYKAYLKLKSISLVKSGKHRKNIRTVELIIGDIGKAYQKLKAYLQQYQISVLLIFTKSY